MRRFATLLAVPALALATPALADVEVTRFHTPESLAEAAPGPIALRAGAGLEDDSLESRLWLDAVAEALTRQGFTVTPTAGRVAEVSLEQIVAEGAVRRSGSGVSVGIGVGSGGGYYRRGGGTSVGFGLGVLLGGGAKRSGERLDTTLAVTIEDSANGRHLWEGRALADTSPRSKDSNPARLAEEMAFKLFTDFPGRSGETIAAR